MAHLQRRGTMGLMGLSQTQSEMQLYCLGEQKNHPETTTDDLCCLSTVRSFFFFFFAKEWSHRITLKGPHLKNGSYPWTPMFYFYSFLKSGIWVWVTSCDGLTMKFCATKELQLKSFPHQTREMWSFLSSVQSKF